MQRNTRRKPPRVDIVPDLDGISDRGSDPSRAASAGGRLEIAS